MPVGERTTTLNQSVLLLHILFVNIFKRFHLKEAFTTNRILKTMRITWNQNVGNSDVTQIESRSE